MKILVERIRRIYINNSLESYQISIFLFDLVGNSLNPENDASYKDFINQYQRKDFETDNPQVYFVSETDAVEGKLGVNLLKQYVNFIPIEKEGALIGHIIIDLKQKKDIPNNVYPELLIDKRFKQPEEAKDYSYAVYADGELRYSYGTYNYEKDFKKNFLRFSSLYTEGYTYNQYKHIGVLGEKNRLVVVSSEAYSNKNIFTNFSFLFLALLFSIIGVLAFYHLRNPHFRIKSTYTTRIQLYLNIAFFLPLIVVSVVTLSLVSNTYEKDLKNAFIRKAQSASNSIVTTLQQLISEEVEKEDLINDLSGVAKYSETDINLFNPEGKLIASSQPSIYESGFLSTYTNPKAYAAIVEQKEKSLMLEESVGTLNYRSVYVAVRSFDNNELLGILSIPFFDAEDEQEKKIINILSTIMNIFTATFIVFLIVSYFASRILTVPLSLITQKIRKTSLQNVNEPLEWDSEDEIGLLVNEYNSMLINLDQSKQALTQSEKESAWREMAKQVAHEIKNPLTPMKLSLQHLQLKLQREFTDIKPVIEKPFETILSQIDTLSDIATSFSNFAKMPMPKNERFDLAETLRSTARLHKDDSNTQILLHIARGRYKVYGDEQLMGRILLNLILNAIQAVPKNRFPEIYINLFITQARKAHLEIRDNGMGIPEEIRDKIFVPNFSTKFTGSGIGLALAKRGIEHAGGRIWFETQEGIGTCFFIELPLAEHFE